METEPDQLARELRRAAGRRPLKPALSGSAHRRSVMTKLALSLLIAGAVTAAALALLTVVGRLL